MFAKHSCNVKNSDSFLRLGIASVIFLYAIYSAYLPLLIISAYFYYSGFKKFCFFYYLFKVNEGYSTTNYYLSFLPKHNPSAVFIFDIEGDLVFKNDASLKEFSRVKSPKCINIQNFREIIQNDKVTTLMIQQQKAHYLIEIQGISKEELLLAYLTDVTEVIELNDEIEETQKEIIYTMGEIGETRSKETGNHVRRVALYSKELAFLSGLSDDEAEKIQMASPMHDIGKVAIPDSVLNAPRKLEKDEWIVMQTHAELGYEMLNKSNKSILKAASIVAYEHHEKWDGSGYPRGLSGEEIHIYGRITAIADVFDALGSDRVYKKAWPLDEILEVFKNERAKHFDPTLIDLFLNNLDNFLAIRDQFKD